MQPIDMLFLRTEHLVKNANPDNDADPDILPCLTAPQIIEESVYMQHGKGHSEKKAGDERHGTQTQKPQQGTDHYGARYIFINIQKRKDTDGARQLPFHGPQKEIVVT